MGKVQFIDRVRARMQRLDGLLLRFRAESAGALPSPAADAHPERLACLPYCVGVGIDVGCGSNKTTPSCIGVDVTPLGTPGRFGNQKRAISAADVQASGDSLPMFRDGQLDFVVARHNIEHYADPILALLEWRRVVREGGHVVVVTPDDEQVDAIHLDPSHKHAFTQAGFRRLIDLIGGLEIVELQPCIPGWSFICVMRKKATGAPAPAAVTT